MARRLNRNKVSASISVSLDFLAIIDEKAFESDKTRSDYIIEAIQEKIAREEK